MAELPSYQSDLEELRAVVEEQRRMIINMSNRVEKLETEGAVLKGNNSRMKKTIETLNDNYDELEEKLSQTRARLEKVEVDAARQRRSESVEHSSVRRAKCTNNDKSELSQLVGAKFSELRGEIDNKQNEMEAKVKYVIRELNKKTTEIEQFNKQIDINYDQLKQGKDEMEKKLKKIDTKHVQLKEGKDEMEKKLEEIDTKHVQLEDKMMQKIGKRNVTSIKETKFIWKIKNILTLNKTSICSEAFYISDYGQKFMLQLYPNRTRKDACGYISLYARIIPGEWDKILKWPLIIKFKCSLIPPNQAEFYSKTTDYIEFELGKRDKATRGFFRFIKSDEVTNFEHEIGADRLLFIELEIINSI